MDYSRFDEHIEGVQVISPRYEYLYVNYKVAEQAEVTRADLLGSTMMEKFPGIENSRAFQEITAALQDREERYFLNEFDRLDGTKGYFELKISPVPEGVMVVSTDISEKKRMEFKEAAERAKKRRDSSSEDSE